jgi:hypothetical protein
MQTDSVMRRAEARSHSLLGRADAVIEQVFAIYAEDNCPRAASGRPVAS